MRSVVFTVEWRCVEIDLGRQTCPLGLYYYDRLSTFKKNKDSGRTEAKKGAGLNKEGLMLEKEVILRITAYLQSECLPDSLIDFFLSLR